MMPNYVQPLKTVSKEVHMEPNNLELLVKWSSEVQRPTKIDSL